jgi:hypothetical protein
MKLPSVRVVSDLKTPDVSLLRKFVRLNSEKEALAGLPWPQRSSNEKTNYKE